MSDPPPPGHFILARVENKDLLNGIIKYYLENSITFTVSKNPHQLVTKAVEEYPMEADSGNSIEQILTEEDFMRGGVGILDEESEQEQQQQQHQKDRIQEAASTSTAEPAALLPTVSRKRKAEDQSPDSKKNSFEPRASKSRTTSVSPAPFTPPLTVEEQEEGVNAVDLLVEDDEPAMEVPTTSTQSTPVLRAAVIPISTNINGPRLVRIVRSSDLETNNNGAARPPNPQDEVICNLRITEAVDWVAKNDCDLAIHMIKEGYLPPSKMCPRCNHKIHPYFQNYRLEWRCMNIHCKGTSYSLFANTWFSYLNLPLKEIMKIIILWSQSHSADDIRLQLRIPIKSVWLVENRIRETCIRIVHSYEPLGGCSVEVQMGLRSIGTKKFHQVSGRSTKTNKQVLVGVEPRTGRCFLHVVTPKKPILLALARWIRPGTLINGCMYQIEPVGDDFVGKLDLRSVDERPYVLDAFNQLAPSDLGDVIGETLPGYLAEMVVRLNEKENTLKKLISWLRYWKLPQPGANGQTVALDLLKYCPEPTSPEDVERAGESAEGQRMANEEEMEQALFGDKDAVKMEEPENNL